VKEYYSSNINLKILKRPTQLTFILLSGLILLIHLSCASYKIIPSPIDPNSQKFLDFIRYIITPQEEKIYREMPPEDRQEFIRDFWKRRDPNPDTEINEFRNQYYTRLAVADKAFSAGIPGYMTDRGRIYILLGPPMDVIKKSMGDATLDLSKRSRDLSSDFLEEGTRTERPTEIWIYNQYPDYFSGPLQLVFVDYNSTGDYKLTTGVEVKPFSMMSYIQNDPNLEKYQWIGGIEQGESSPQIPFILDYSISIGRMEKTKEKNYMIPCSFEVPFRSINYRKEKENLVYDIEFSVEVQNVESKGTYRVQRDKGGSLSFEKLQQSVNDGVFLSEEMTVPLEKGINNIYFCLRDNIQQKKLRKLKIIKIE